MLSAYCGPLAFAGHYSLATCCTLEYFCEIVESATGRDGQKSETVQVCIVVVL